MSEVKRFKMPWHDDPMSWPIPLRKPGTEVVLASEWEALRASNERLIHDIERSQSAAADLATENARLREWLAVAVEVYEALNGPAVSDGHWANQSKKALEGGAT